MRETWIAARRGHLAVGGKAFWTLIERMLKTGMVLKPGEGTNVEELR